MEPKWRRFEKLIAGIQKQLTPNAIIKHDDQIFGHQSQKYRQIDVSIRHRIGQYNLLIAMSCKDWKEPVDIEEVDSFASVILDIRANKGAMVAAKGFTDGAKNMAKAKGIDLYRLIDAEAHEWQTYISIPVVCDFRSLSQYQLALPRFLQHEKYQQQIVLYNYNQQRLGTIHEYVHKRWNSGKLPTDPGEHGFIKLAEEEIQILYEGKHIAVDIGVRVRVQKKLYLGQLQLIDIKGFRDEYSGNLVTNGFTTEWLEVKRAEREWRQINDMNEIAIFPLLTLSAFDIYEV